MRNLALLFIVLSFSSCISNWRLVKSFSKANKDAHLKSIANLNGNYKNLDSANTQQLISCLGSSYSRKWDDNKIKIQNPAQITINYDGRKHLSVRVHSKDTLAPFVLKVKNKGSYLSVKRHLRILPIPFCYFYWESKQILFNDSSGRLVSVNRKMSTGWVLFMVAGNDATSIYAFDRADVK